MAKSSFADIEFYYTGGGANSNTTLSIGGAKSSAQVLCQTLSSLTTLTGVVLNDGWFNNPGDGTLSYDPVNTLMYWQGFGESTGSGVDVSVSGDYFIQSNANGGGVSVTVTAASLPTGTTTVSNVVTVANRTEQWFLDQTGVETDSGVNKYHCFFVKNAHATKTVYGMKMYFNENTPGQDNMLLFLDPLAAGDGSVGPTAVANENTAPAASTFVAPTSATSPDALDIGTLTAGQGRFFWLYQATPSNCSVETLVNTFKLGLFAKFS